MSNKRRRHHPERVVTGHELGELLAALESSPVGTRLVLFDCDHLPASAADGVGSTRVEVSAAVNLDGSNVQVLDDVRRCSL